VQHCDPGVLGLVALGERAQEGLELLVVARHEQRVHVALVGRHRVEAKRGERGGAELLRDKFALIRPFFREALPERREVRRGEAIKASFKLTPCRVTWISGQCAHEVIPGRCSVTSAEYA